MEDRRSKSIMMNRSGQRVDSIFADKTVTEMERRKYFKRLMQKYGNLLLPDKDYRRLSFPKNLMVCFGTLWFGGYVGLGYMYRQNRARFFKSFLFTAWSPIYFLVLPVCSITLFWRASKRRQSEMYEKYGKDYNIE